MYRNVGKHKRLSAADVNEREPAVLRAGLEGGATYWDAATDDARLTMMNVIGAEEAGALVINHAEVTSLTRTLDKVDGVVVRDRLSDMTVRVRARVVVNATGPWTDAMRRLEDPSAPEAVRGTKGVHLLVPRERIGNTSAITLLHPADQRVMFALPAGAYAILGTTDTRTDAGPEQVRASANDVRYLLDASNTYFPAAKLVPSDVITAWAGIRPLIASSPKDAPSDQSRESEVAVGSGGVIGVSGGKLTTNRSMAEEIVDVVADLLRRKQAKSDTAHAPLPGGDLADVQAEIGVASEVCGDIGIATHLVHWHGSNWRAVWALGDATPALRERVVPTSDAIRAEMVHAVRHEHAHALADLLVRRTHVAFESRDHGLTAAADVAGLIAPELGWTAAQREAAVATYEAEARRLFAVDPA